MTTGRPSRRERLAKQETVEIPVPISSDESDVVTPEETSAPARADGEVEPDGGATSEIPAVAVASGEVVRRALAKMATQEIAVPHFPGEGGGASTPGSRRYAVQRKLAEGTFGVVSEAIDERSGRLVALKTLKAGTAPLDVARFEREADTARRLEHPGLVRVLDSGVEDGAPYIAFELVPGKTLDARIREEGPLPEREALELALALARAVAHAHERGVLHRDVSPRNVLLTPLLAGGVRPVLADFGLAKDLLASDALTRTGDILGTPVTLAPEVLKGGAARADERTDVFGLGAVLYYALTGRPPFEAASLDELATRIEQGVPPPRGVSLGTAALLTGALAPRREDRPPSATRFAEICQQALGSADDAPASGGATRPARLADTQQSTSVVLSSQKSTSGVPSTLPLAPGSGEPRARDSKAPRRTGKLLATAALGLGLAGAIAGGIAWKRGQSRARALTIVADAERKSATPPSELLTAANAALAIAPDLEDARALRALARARMGDLAHAEEDLAHAGDGGRAKRARVWVLFRQGQVDEALRSLSSAPVRQSEWNALTFAAGREDFSFREPDRAPPAPGSSLWWKQNLSGTGAKFMTVHANVDSIIEANPGTIESHRALLLRVLTETLALEDEAADRDLARALDAPPRERALAEGLRARLVKLRAGGELTIPEPTATPWPYPEQTALRDEADDVVRVARFELERHRLLDGAADLARATTRLRRIVELQAGSLDSLLLLSHALSRAPKENDASLRKLAVRLAGLRSEEAIEAARAYFALGDEPACRAVLGKIQEDPAAVRLGVPDRLAALVAKDDRAAARALGLSVEGPGDLSRAASVLRALVLDRPWQAAGELEELRSQSHAAPRSSALVAAAMARTDPLAALSALARDPANARPTGDVGRIAGVLAGLLPGEPEKVKAQLVARELTEAEATQGLKLLALGRSERGAP